MLVKCVCSNCGHSYLADNQAGGLECPRCGVGHEPAAGGSPAPDLPPPPAGLTAPMDYGDFDDYGAAPPEDESYGAYGGFEEPRFAPRTPPPMILSSDRLLRGALFAAFCATFLGLALGAALTAIRFVVPAVFGLVLAVVVGGACRAGFGGRTSSQTRIRAVLVVTIAVGLGFGGLLTGSWIIDRLTGTRAEVTRQDLDRGTRNIARQRARNKDAGEAIVLDRRAREVEELKAMSDPELEDYLWKQEAQLAHPLLAYGKLRALKGPVVQLGPSGKTVELKQAVTGGLLLAEMLLAIVLAVRMVLPRR